MTNGGAVLGGSKMKLLTLGLLVGVALGIATSLLFLMIVAAPLLGIAISLAGWRANPTDLPRTAAGAGLLLGSGGVYLYGALNTLISCSGSSVCGGASALPFLAWALAIVAIGVVMAALAFGRRR